jgi:hypothetical protein
VNNNDKAIVRPDPNNRWRRDNTNKAWWAYVNVALLNKSTTVFSNGTSNGLMAHTPIGCLIHPISTLGDKEEWKKAQKTDANTAISEITKSTNPSVKPDWTLKVWYPW